MDSSFPPVRVGDEFRLEIGDIGDCDADCWRPSGELAICALDLGHGGPHVATDGKRVTAVWDQA